MKRMVVGALALAGVAYGGWLGYQAVAPLLAGSPEVGPVERALALPDLVVLGSLDVAALSRLDELLHGAPDASLETPDEDGDLLSLLGEAGIDARRDISHVVAAVYLGSGTTPGRALVVSGSFRTDGIEAHLRESPDFEVIGQVDAGGQRVLHLRVRDRETCELGEVWALHTRAGRVVLSDPERAADVLRALDAADAPAGALERFQAFRGRGLASLALFVPEAVPAGISNPMLQMGAEAARGALGGFEAAYFTAAVDLVPPGVGLEMLLEARDPGVAEATAERWRLALDGFVGRVGDKLPTLGELVQALQIENDAHEVHLAAHLDRAWAENAERLPAELLGMLFGGFSISLSSGTGLAIEEQLDLLPVRFAAQTSAAALAPYDPSAHFAGAAEATSGPFGMRVAAVSVGDDPKTGLEVEIEARGTGIGNLGDAVDRARLRVVRALDAEGRDLLRVEHCGPERNELAAPFTAGFGNGVLQASKRARLVPGTRLADVARLVGEVELSLPVRTETLELAASAGELVERNGVRFEITSASGGSVSYRLSGVLDRLLHVRGLNAARLPLRRQSSSASQSPFGGAKSGSIDYAGKLASVEVVLATEERTERFPFELDRIRPGTEGEQPASEPVEFVDYSLERLQREFTRPYETISHDGEPPRAVSRTGPFLVALGQLQSFMGISSEIAVRAPNIPNLQHALSGLELRLRSIRLRDGTVHRGPTADASPGGWSQLLSLGRSFGAEGLRASTWLSTGVRVEPEQVERISGALVLRLPRGLETLSIDTVEPGASVSSGELVVTLRSIGRDRFELSAPAGGERVLAARAYNAAGEELWVPRGQVERDAAGWRASFQVSGIPERIEVVVARSLDVVDYGFTLQLADADAAPRT